MIKDRRKHLRSYKPLPDQLVELEEVVVQIFANVFRRACDVGRPHGFVRFLGVFLRLIEVRLLGEVIRAKLRRDEFADLRQRVVRNMHRVRAHVRDQRDGALRAQLHAFIESLRQRHGALGGVAQPVVGRLLQFRRRERRRRIAPLLLLRHRRHLPLGLAHRRNNLVGGLLVLDFHVSVVVLDELGFEQRRLACVQRRVDGPIFLRHERANGLFALNDQP